MNWYKRHIYAGSLPSYDSKELVDKMALFGIEYIGEGRGDHQIFRSPLGKIKELPTGGKKSINPTTVKQHVVSQEYGFGIPNIVWRAGGKRPSEKDIGPLWHLLPWGNTEPPWGWGRYGTEDPTRHNVDLGEPTGRETPKPYENEPWYIEQKKREAAEKLKAEEEERWLAEEIRKEELAKLTPSLGSNKMNWYKKANKWKDKIPGGIADGKRPSDFKKEDIERGKKIEYEHTNDPAKAREISMDHLEEHPDYYDPKKGLPAMEKKLEKNKPARRGRYEGGVQRVNLQ